MSLTAQITRTILTTLVVCLVLVAAANDAATQKTTGEEKKGGSTIRGVVTYADTGHPLRHSGVSLINNDTSVWSGNGVTDGRGRFELENVPAGRYLLTVDAPGILMPEGSTATVGSMSAQLRLSETRDLFTEVVVNGTDSVDVRVQAVRGGAITGRVISEDDQPVPGADIKLLKRANGKWLPVDFTWTGPSQPRKDLQTDPSGVYRIAGLHAGEYIVRVSEPVIGSDGKTQDDEAYSNGQQMVTYYPSVLTIKEAQAVTVVEGRESTGVDVRMPDRAARTLSGTVTVGAENQPVAYAEIVIERPDEGGFINSEMDSSTRADDEGKWELRGIPEGEYVLRFGGTTRVGAGEKQSHIYLAPKEVRVTVAHDDVVLHTKLSRAALVTGKVKFDGPPPERLFDLNPSLILADDKQERPPNNQGRNNRPGYSSGHVSEGGAFDITRVVPGKYWFLMSGFAADQYYVKSITRNGVDITQKPIKVEARKVFDGVLVTLASDLATIEGQLQLAEVNPKTSVEDIVVMLAPANDATRRFSTGLLTLHPDAKGKFTFRCGPGEYFIATFTRSQRQKLTTPITEDYFKQDTQKLLRVKVKAGEKLTGVTVSLQH